MIVRRPSRLSLMILRRLRAQGGNWSLRWRPVEGKQRELPLPGDDVVRRWGRVIEHICSSGCPCSEQVGQKSMLPSSKALRYGPMSSFKV